MEVQPISTNLDTVLNDVLTLSQAVLFELPLSGLEWRFDKANERKAHEVMWKGYDAAIHLTVSVVDIAYSTPLLNLMVIRGLDSLVRWQQLETVLGTFSAKLWRLVGLPPAADLQAVRTEVLAGREQCQPKPLNQVPRVQLNSASIAPPLPAPGMPFLLSSCHSMTDDSDTPLHWPDFNAYFEPLVDVYPNCPEREHNPTADRGDHLDEESGLPDFSAYFEPVADGPDRSCQPYPQNLDTVPRKPESELRLSIPFATRSGLPGAL